MDDLRLNRVQIQTFRRYVSFNRRESLSSHSSEPCPREFLPSIAAPLAKDGRRTRGRSRLQAEPRLERVASLLSLGRPSDIDDYRSQFAIANQNFIKLRVAQFHAVGHAC